MTSIDTKTLIDLFNGLKVDINTNYLDKKNIKNLMLQKLKK